MLFLLPCPADSVAIVVVVVMGWHCKHALMRVVQVVAAVLLQRLPVPAVVLPDIGLGVAVEIVLGELGGSFPAWQVVLRCLQIVQISGGGIPWCCRSGSDYRRTSGGPHLYPRSWYLGS